MELKPYQQDVIKDLELFISYLNKYNNPKLAFDNYWENKVGKYNPLTNTGMRPYRDNIPNAIHIAIKVPTAGGKTFIACNAIHSINKYLNNGNTKAIVWLVPWSNLLQQTYTSLSNPNHSYREKLNSLFGHRVEVYLKEHLLQGANFNPSSVNEQLNIFVLNYSSLRIDKAKKEDRKIFQENGSLESFRSSVVDENIILEGTDETALINVIRSLNPIVIVDESHNAESNLSVEMLQNLNPSLVLDLTATPKENSNIISFVSALKLKQENMVKLPVIVYNHHKKEEVISSALHLQKELEIHSLQEEKETGKYIRPIILFQAQSNIKGKNNTTFQNIKEQLVKIGIPEEQIKIKVSGIDELKDIDLMDRESPVRYIITVNALKEGWDCPNAYILASLADKSSAVDVEQILGRILRQPYVSKHINPLLNMSYVLTASSRFKETLDSIVKGLQDSGFSKEDYFAEEEKQIELSNSEILQSEFFENKDVKGDNDSFDVDSISFEPLNTNEIDSVLADVEVANTSTLHITEKAKEEYNEFSKQIEKDSFEDSEDYFKSIMNSEPKKYFVEDNYKSIVSDIKIPQFFLKTDEDELSSLILFEELKESEILLSKNSLLKGFNLLEQDTKIDFSSSSADVFSIDFDENKRTTIVNKVSLRAKNVLLNNILSKPKDKQIQDVSNIIINKLGDMTPISHNDLVKYVNRVFEGLSTEQITELVNNDFIYFQKIKNKINELSANYSKRKFLSLLDSNDIFTKPSFILSEYITLTNNISTPIGKSLYQAEDTMNGFEMDMILEIASLDNILFWHRNLNRGKGFFINGSASNHFPDFIIFTRKGNIIIVETKGDDRNNSDSREKNRLGKLWANKAGDNFKYFMVFQKIEVEDCYNASSIVDVLSRL